MGSFNGDRDERATANVKCSCIFPFETTDPCQANQAACARERRRFSIAPLGSRLGSFPPASRRASSLVRQAARLRFAPIR